MQSILVCVLIHEQMADDSSDISPTQMEWSRFEIKIPSCIAMIEYQILIHSLSHPNSDTPKTGQEVQQGKRQTKDQKWNTQKTRLSSHRGKHPSDHLFVTERF